MSENVKARLHAAVWAAIAELGENEARAIINEIFNKIGQDWYGR